MAFDKFLEICSTLVSTPFSLPVVFMLTENWRYSRRKTSWLAFLTVTILLALDIFVYCRTGVTKAGRDVITVLNYTVMVALYLFLPKYEGGKSVFVCFSVSVFMLAGASVSEIFGTTVPLYRLGIKIGVYLTILFITCKYVRRPFFTVMKEIEKGWIKMAAIPFTFGILLIAVLYTGEMYHDREIKMIGLALCFSICVIYVVLYYTFCSLQEQYKIKSGYELLQAQMSSLQRQVEIIRESGKEMSILRHDMRHYIVLLSACVEKREFEEARELTKSLKLSLDSVSRKDRSYTGNILIDSILSEYESRSEAERIQFDAMVILPEAVLNNPVEFAVVLANALENACTACRRIPEGEERIIKVRGRMEKGSFFVEIANTCSGEIQLDPQNGRPVSNREGHGYGTQSIAAFAEKNHAYLKYQVDSGWFRLRLIFKNGS